jgi:hypothetical protein
MQQVFKSPPNILHAKVVADNQTHYFGDPAQRAVLKAAGVKMMLDMPVGTIDFVIIDREIRVFGSKGGSNAPYSLIEWCYRRRQGFGIGIENIMGRNLPYFILKDAAEIRRAFRALKTLGGKK